MTEEDGLQRERDLAPDPKGERPMTVQGRLLGERKGEGGTPGSITVYVPQVGSLVLESNLVIFNRVGVGEWAEITAPEWLWAEKFAEMRGKKRQARPVNVFSS